MTIKIIGPYSQVCCVLILVLTAVSCNLKKGEEPVIPPVSFPLSREYIGFGVINVSYTRVSENPEEEGVSPGYLRRGAVVCIHERKLIKTNDKTETWLLVEESCRGWLKESLVDVYENESQAKTASDKMIK